MRIIAKRTLHEFWEQPDYQDAEQPLKAWYAEAKDATWRTPADIKAHYRHASIVGDNRVVFNIAGNKYRLVVKFHYNTGIGYVRFNVIKIRLRKFQKCTVKQYFEADQGWSCT